ncbi:MAG: ERF family protein [Methylibium sp.]|nr:ERF family protein [Methylibium sp.]
MNKSDSITELATSLAKAQAKIRGAAKDAANPHFKSRYADLASVWESCRDALTANGLSVVQGASANGAQVTVTTMLLHSSGQWIEDALTVPAQQANAQGIGSAITYARRYALAAMVGVAPDDDDGESAVVRGSGGAVQSRQVQPRQSATAPVAPQPPTDSQVPVHTLEQLRAAFKRAEESTTREQAIEALGRACGKAVQKAVDVPASQYAMAVEALDSLAGLVAR